MDLLEPLCLGSHRAPRDRCGSSMDENVPFPAFDLVHPSRPKGIYLLSSNFSKLQLRNNSSMIHLLI